MDAPVSAPLPRRRVRGRVVVTVLVAALAMLLAAVTGPSVAGAATTGNPLAGGRWGVYTGSADGIYPAYQQATGRNKQLLAKIALRPRVRWFGSWSSADSIGKSISSYIASEQNGDPNTLVQLAVFKVFYGGEKNVRQPVTAAEQAEYKQWVNNAAKAIGSARVALILEPDLAVSRSGWSPATRYRMAAYAARVFSALPRTSVYIDASSSDWLTVPDAVSMLRTAGIGLPRVRGFALNATHYDSTTANVLYGQQLVSALAKARLGSKHFVVNTADTGRPFTWKQYWAAHPHGNFDNAETCRTRTQTRCVTLGIPPTANVGYAGWHLPAAAVSAARRSCDAYLWFGRPWLDNQAAPFDMNRSLQVAATTPY